MYKEKKQNWYVNPKRYHFIYKTTCKVNGKFYYGMHSTDSLDDGYVGSGTRLWHAIKKHGRENFSIEILEFLPDRESLKKREAELITEEMLKDPMCMNLKLGGDGGWYLTEEQYKSRNKKCSTAFKLKLLDENFKSEFTQKLKAGHLKRTSYVTPDWSGRKHKDETKLKMQMMAKMRTGEKNSSFGSRWMTNGSEERKTKDYQMLLQQGWSFGRVC